MYYKGTQQECIDYDATVTAAKNYQGVTKNWANPVEIEGVWYILKHENYDCSLNTVDKLPQQQNKEI